MIFRVLMFFLGILLASIGLSFIIIYLNLLNMGYNFWEYVNFISRRIECLGVFLGLFLVFISVYRKGNKNDICL